MVLLEGYIAKWKKYPENEIKLRVARPSMLAPSKELLYDYMYRELLWEEYKKRFRKEIKNSPHAREFLRFIGKVSKLIDIRLLCFEKPPKHCHRYLLMDIIKKMEKVK